MSGEIGGADEENAARYIAQSQYPMPVAAYIAGVTSPEGKRKGHAGAIVEDDFGTAKHKE